MIMAHPRQEVDCLPTTCNTCALCYSAYAASADFTLNHTLPYLWVIDLPWLAGCAMV